MNDTLLTIYQLDSMGHDAAMAHIMIIGERPLALIQIGGGLAIARPCPMDVELKPLAGETEKQLRELLVNHEPVFTWTEDFAILLTWASRRQVVGDPADDPQRIAGRLFNRWLLREALQTLVELGGGPLQCDMLALRDGYCLRIRCPQSEVTILLMGMADRLVEWKPKDPFRSDLGRPRKEETCEPPI